MSLETLPDEVNEVEFIGKINLSKVHLESMLGRACSIENFVQIKSLALQAEVNFISLVAMAIVNAPEEREDFIKLQEDRAMISANQDELVKCIQQASVKARQEGTH